MVPAPALRVRFAPKRSGASRVVVTPNDWEFEGRAASKRQSVPRSRVSCAVASTEMPARSLSECPLAGPAAGATGSGVATTVDQSASKRGRKLRWRSPPNAARTPKPLVSVARSVPAAAIRTTDTWEEARQSMLEKPVNGSR